MTWSNQIFMKWAKSLLLSDESRRSWTKEIESNIRGGYVERIPLITSPLCQWTRWRASQIHLLTAQPEASSLSWVCDILSQRLGIFDERLYESFRRSSGWEMLRSNFKRRWQDYRWCSTSIFQPHNSMLLLSDNHLSLALISPCSRQRFTSYSQLTLVSP